MAKHWHTSINPLLESTQETTPYSALGNNFSTTDCIFQISLPLRVLAANRMIDNHSARRRGFSRGAMSGRVFSFVIH